MKTITSVVPLFALFVGTLVLPQVSSAYTISVGCQENNLAPPGRPWPNIDCWYEWEDDGDNPLNFRGSWSADLRYRGDYPFGGVDIRLDYVSRPQFTFSDYASPDSVYIKCVNQTKSHQVIMVGRSYKYVISGTGPGYWSPQQLETDSQFTFITNPVNC